MYCILTMCAQSLSCVQLFATPQTIAVILLCLWDFSGKNTGVGCHSLLQSIILTQGSNPHLLCLLLRKQQILYLLSHLGQPQWVLGGKELFQVGARLKEASAS